MPTKTSRSQFELFKLLRPYLPLVLALFVMSLGWNITNLLVPRLAANAIDEFSHTGVVASDTWAVLIGVTAFSFVFDVLQVALGVYASEKVALDFRTKLARKLSIQDYSYVTNTTPSKLLTVLTSDVDAVKMVISQALPSMFAGVIMVIGSAVALLSIDFGLGLLVLTIVPVVIIAFRIIFSRISGLFAKVQETIDKLNRVINETIIGANLVRVLNSQLEEDQKFSTVSAEAKTLGTQIVTAFASLVPVITLVANLIVVGVVWFGGQGVINGDLSIGQFTAFYSYIALLVAPLLILGFISNLLVRSGVSYGRINSVLHSSEPHPRGNLKKEIAGEIEFRNVSLAYDNRSVLKDISFKIPKYKRTAIIGPTAAGKTQIFYLLAGLVTPTSGDIYVDGHHIDTYEPGNYFSQVGLVFQDSALFNTTLRENINFSQVDLSESDLKKAVNTAALSDLVTKLPKGLETPVSERGTSLSGGQKQRVMLARALSLEPKLLLLDDFTARVDNATESFIFKELAANYPNQTVVLITQKISSVEDFDQIILLMEGELLATGTHKQLLEDSFEYRQIYKSQQTANED